LEQLQKISIKAIKRKI